MTEIEKFEELEPTAETEKKASTGVVLESEKLTLAKSVLVSLIAVYGISAIGRICCQSVGAETVFESVKQTVPPIVTLILGYYFSRK